MPSSPAKAARRRSARATVRKPRRSIAESAAINGGLAATAAGIVYGMTPAEQRANRQVELAAGVVGVAAAAAIHSGIYAALTRLARADIAHALKTSNSGYRIAQVVRRYPLVPWDYAALRRIVNPAEYDHVERALQRNRTILEGISMARTVHHMTKVLQ